MTRLLIAAGALALTLGAAGNATAQELPPAKISILDASASEADGQIDFTIGMNRAVDGPVVLNLSYLGGSSTLSVPAPGLARHRHDVPGFNTLDQTFRFEAGETFKTLSVPIIEDDGADGEGNETFTVTISVRSSPPNDAVEIVPSRTTATGTIRNGDTSPPLPSNDATVSIADAEAVEGAGAIVFTVSLSAAASSNVVLDVDVNAGSGNDPVTLADDLGTGPTTVTVRRGDTSATIRVPITDDEDIEENETFAVAISESEVARLRLPAGVTIRDGEATGTIIDDDDPSTLPPFAAAATVSIDDVEVAENVAGGVAEFTATLSAAVASDVELEVTYARGSRNGVTLADDLGTRPSTVRIRRGATSAAIRVSIVNDGLQEQDETFTVTIALADGAPSNVTVDGSTALGTIRNDDRDPPPAMVSIADAEAVEGDAMFFTVFLDRAVPREIVLDVRLDAITASLGDLNLSPEAFEDIEDDPATEGRFRRYNVTIAPNATSATWRVWTNQDTTPEGRETFGVTISEVSDRQLVGVEIEKEFATGTIVDDDFQLQLPRAKVSIADADVVEEGRDARFTVFLDQEVYTDVQLYVDYSAEDGDTATVLDDLVNPPSAVRIYQGDTSATIRVPTFKDELVEAAGETFTVSIRDAIGIVDIDDGEAKGRIVDNVVDIVDGEPRVSIADAAVAEEGGNASFTVFLSQKVDSAVTLNVAYAGGSTNPATPADDLGAAPATVTINQGDISATLVVPIADDSIGEGAEDETFTVTISGSRVDIGDGEATGKIRDNDKPSARASIADATVVEDGGNAFFTVFLSEAVDSDVTLAVAYAGSGDNPATPADDLGTSLEYTVTIEEGATSAILEVPIFDDDFEEEDETFTVTLSANTATPLPVGLVIGDGEATGKILDNHDAPAPVDVTVSIAPVTVAEGDGNAVFTATLSGAVDSAVTLDVAYAGSGNNPVTLADDLVGTPPATVTISQGATTASITVPIRDDDTEEEDETFTVTLSATTLPDGVVIPGGSATATGTITDNDGDVTVSIAPVTVGEGDGDAVFMARLSRAADSAVTLDVAVTPGSTNPVTLADDLGTLPTTVTIAQGSLTAPITVPILPDTVEEENETFTVTLSATTLPDGVVIPGGAAAATGTITDDDGTDPPAPAVTASIADDVTVPEGGDAVFTAILSEAVNEDVVLGIFADIRPGDTATISAEDGTAPDLRAPPFGFTVTIPAGEISETFSVETLADREEEGDETFTVLLGVSTSRLPSGVAIADDGTQTATGTIIDSSGPNSVLAEAREIGAGTALRRHARRFDSLTGAVVRNRLDARATRRLNASENVGNGAAAAGGGLGETRWGAWIDGAWAGFDGKASGRQADVYGGVDYQAGDWLIGALIGYETADLDIGDATYRSDYTQLGVYGGARLSERLLFDGAATYGTATPDISEGAVTASYDARRVTVRGALTGDFGLEYGRGIKVQPRLGVLVSREQLHAFGDSDGGTAGRETLKLGRFSAGPRLSWEFDGGQVAGGVRAQWDFLELDDGVGNRISGAADIGVNLDLTPNVTLGVQGDIDGIGISDDFGSLGGRIKLDVRF